MTEYTEPNRTGGFIATEANGDRSRDQEVLASGENVVAGQVLGKVTASGKYAAYDSGAADGTEVAAGVAYSNVDASAADADIVVIKRDCEVIREELVWPGGQGSANEVAGGVTELNGLGIMLR